MWDETLYNRAFRVSKSIEELIFDAEQQELLNKAIAALPEIQRRQFLLYHEYNFNYRQIGEMEHCRPQSINQALGYSGQGEDKGGNRKISGWTVKNCPISLGMGQSVKCSLMEFY